MPEDVDEAKSPARRSSENRPDIESDRRFTVAWLHTPEPVKRIFDKFPLTTYSANTLPHQRKSARSEHALYVYTTFEDASLGRPSFNPGCLKWQTYLLFNGVDFVTLPSNNHASPTGALPFLLPPATHQDLGQPIVSSRLERWINDRKRGQASTKSKETEASISKDAEAEQDMRHDAYTSLLEYRIRNAYLYSLYLDPVNFTKIAIPLYIHPSSSNLLVQWTLQSQLRIAAKTELFKSSPIIDERSLLREADRAFMALSELLGEDEWFFTKEAPELFDANVFAYTNVILDEKMGWREIEGGSREEKSLQGMLREWKNLVLHRERILQRYYP